jgi:RNA polymerase sigma factor (TIGR02999 family)
MDRRETTGPFSAASDEMPDVMESDATPGAALDASFAAFYDDLRRIARRHLRNERIGHTLCTTGLVNESYLKLASRDDGRWRDRAQFFALASRAMRHILVDHARGRGTQKRGGGEVQVTLHTGTSITRGEHLLDVLALDEALARLGALSPRLERVVECRFFGGLSAEETAEALGTSVRTVEREWSRARAYLLRLLDDAATVQLQT